MSVVTAVLHVSNASSFCPGGTPPEDLDMFHDLILWDELGRDTSGGLVAAVFVSMTIALPLVLDAGSDFIKNKVAPGVVSGN